MCWEGPLTHQHGLVLRLESRECHLPTWPGMGQRASLPPWIFIEQLNGAGEKGTPGLHVLCTHVHTLRLSLSTKRMNGLCTLVSFFFFPNFMEASDSKGFHVARGF